MSAATSWAGLPFEAHQMRTVERACEVGPIEGEYGMLIVTSGRLDVVRQDDDRAVCLAAMAGTVALLSGECRQRILRTRGDAEAIVFQIPFDWFQRLALTGFASRFGSVWMTQRDETARQFACAMRDEVARSAVTGRLYAESLSATLLSYVAGAVPSADGALRGRLSDAECAKLRGYVRDHLHEELSLSQLSALVGLGPRQFSNVFRRAFGTSPHRYVLRERLNEGARLLSTTEAEVAEVAEQLGFCNQSHFTLAFRRAFGVTPWRYACSRRVG